MGDPGDTGQVVSRMVQADRGTTEMLASWEATEVLARGLELALGSRTSFHTSLKCTGAQAWEPLRLRAQLVQFDYSTFYFFCCCFFLLNLN